MAEEPVAEEPVAGREPASQPASPGEHRHRRRLGRGSILAAVLLAALGFSLVVQVRQTQVGGLSSLSQPELLRILGTLNNKSQQVDAETQELLATEAELRSGSDKAATAEANARRGIQQLSILAGTVPATGPGVQLRMENAAGTVNAAAVLNAVQELRDAGAEALQISSPGGAVRIVVDTAFTDPRTPGTQGIRAAGTALQSPYTITAIGQADTMASALNIPGGVLDSLRQSGARGSVQTAERLTVSAVRPPPSQTYATPGGG